LIKIEEHEVEIQCKAEDVATVNKILSEAVSEYQSAMKAAGHTERGSKPKVSVSSTNIPSKGCAGGF
jgi:uncharacterized protein YggE